MTKGSLGFLLLWVTELDAFPGSMLCENSWKLCSLMWWDMGSLNSWSMVLRSISDSCIPKHVSIHASDIFPVSTMVNTIGDEGQISQARLICLGQNQSPSLSQNKLQCWQTRTNRTTFKFLHKLQSFFYERLSDVAENWAQWRADFQSGSGVFKKVLYGHFLIYV